MDFTSLLFGNQPLAQEYAGGQKGRGDKKAGNPVYPF